MPQVRRMQRQSTTFLSAFTAKLDPVAAAIGHISNTVNDIQHQVEANTVRIETLEAARPQHVPHEARMAHLDQRLAEITLKIEQVNKNKSRSDIRLPVGPQRPPVGLLALRRRTGASLQLWRALRRLPNRRPVQC